MASIADLVRIVASVEGFEENFVSVYARSAREAGFISHHGRGRNAARMTVNDAANLLIAVNASPLAKEVPATIRIFGSLRLPKSVSNKLREDYQVEALAKPGVMFADALAFLLNVGPGGALNVNTLIHSTLLGEIPSPPPRSGSSTPALEPIQYQHRGDIRVDFFGTNPKAQLLVTNYDAAGSEDVRRVELLNCRFYDLNREPMDIDRTTITSITSKTLTEVAELINS